MQSLRLIRLRIALPLSNQREFLMPQRHTDNLQRIGIRFPGRRIHPHFGNRLADTELPFSPHPVREHLALRRVEFLFSGKQAAIAQFLGSPFSSMLVHLAGTAIMFCGLYLALAIISGKGMRSALWVGAAFLSIMWIWVEHGGDFNPAAGGTDAGIAPPYLIALILTYLTWQFSQPSATTANAATHHETIVWMHAVRVMFGFLWAWDALFKLHPYFITHIVELIAGAESGQPSWIAAYLHVWVAIMTHTSPLFFGIVSAIAEVAIAWSLLSGRMLRIFLPVGFAYSLMIWSIAEGFGGPYGSGTIGMAGNMFGNAVIYAIIFAFFMTIYRWPRKYDDTLCIAKKSEQESAPLLGKEVIIVLFD